jgi:hypothetical protein
MGGVLVLDLEQGYATWFSNQVWQGASPGEGCMRYTMQGVWSRRSH